MKGLLRRLLRRFQTTRSGIQGAPRSRPAAAHPVEVRVLGRRSTEVFRARDLSLTGIAVFVPPGLEGFDPDSEVELAVSLPIQRLFITHGRIRHATEVAGEPPFFGAEFTDLSAEHREGLATYLASSFAQPLPRTSVP